MAKKLEEWWKNWRGIVGYVACGRVAKKLEGWEDKIGRDGWLRS
jgi:hypothetical protein